MADDSFMCFECGDDYGSEAELNKHLETHNVAANLYGDDNDVITAVEVNQYGSESNDDECNGENIEAKDKSNTMPELSETHASLHGSSADHSDENTSENLVNQTEVFSCIVCGGTTDSYASFQRHMLIHLDAFLDRSASNNEDSEMQQPSVGVREQSVLAEDKSVPGIKSEDLDNEQVTSNTMQCIECGEVCGTQNLLVAHIISCHDTANKTIDEIEHDSAEGSQLDEDSEVSDNGSESGDFDDVSTVFTKIAAVSQDNDGSDEKPYSCCVCGSSFSSNEELAEHIENHVDEGEQVDGDVCDPDYKPHSKVNIQKRPVNKEKTTYSRNVHVRIGAHDIIPLDGQYTCPECSKQFTERAVFRRHLRGHFRKVLPDGNYTCPECSKEFTVGAVFRRHHRGHFKKIIPDGNYTCPECSKEFVTRSVFTRHLRGHKDKKVLVDGSYTCSQCSKEFTKRAVFRRHCRRHNKKVLPDGNYTCPECSKQFVTRAVFTRHLRGHNELRYKCPECDNSFTQRYLVIHMRTHSGDKPFPCLECGARFARNCYLNEHMRVHTGERPYACTICYKRFTHKCHLNSHIRTHTGERPYQCDFCSKAFTESGRLKKHRRIHTGERPCLCSFCGKTFTENSSLRKHIATHTGIKPFPCILCKKSFMQSDALTGHMRTHLKDNNLYTNLMKMSNSKTNSDSEDSILNDYSAFELTHGPVECEQADDASSDCDSPEYIPHVDAIECETADHAIMPS